MFPPRRKLYKAIAPIWLLVLIVGSLLPYEAKVAMGSRPGYPVSPKTRVATLKHRTFHWLSFGSTALLLMLLARGRKEDLLATTATMALGMAIEWTQHVMYHSRLEWWDVRDDTYAALAALLLVLFTPVKRALVRDDAPAGQLTGSTASEV